MNAKPRLVPEPYLRHRRPMLLLDAVSEFGDNFAEAEVTITPGSMFFDADLGGVPAWIGVEYMAQTIAAFAGFEAKKRSAQPKIGYLISVRKYTVILPLFLDRTTLSIRAQLSQRSENVGIFECMIGSRTQQFAAGRLGVFETDTSPLTTADA